ncbi:MAG: hypothetical protein A2Z14_16535 [Chloroflexi bacterium RBG_16_48_8]|nr:MAG: hypothetical protein A2Z14_16535 [Chloroflexi bacterium RBG_16_48_8]
MAEATVTWLQDQIFVGTGSTKHSVVLSSHGKEGGVGMKPSELMLVTLASCTAVDIVNIFEKMRTPLSGLEIRIHGSRMLIHLGSIQKSNCPIELKGMG